MKIFYKGLLILAVLAVVIPAVAMYSGDSSSKSSGFTSANYSF